MAGSGDDSYRVQAANAEARFVGRKCSTRMACRRERDAAPMPAVRAANNHASRLGAIPHRSEWREQRTHSM